MKNKKEVTQMYNVIKDFENRKGFTERDKGELKALKWVLE